MEISAEIADLLTCNNPKRSYNNNERLKQQGFLKIEYKATVKKLNFLKVGGYKIEQKQWQTAHAWQQGCSPGII